MFLVIGMMMTAFVVAMRSTTSSLGEYPVRYIATGQYAIVYGEDDEISYHRLTGGKEAFVSEEEHLKIYEEYQQRFVISYAYGAGGRTPSGRR